MESALNGLSFAVLLTSLYILRFRGWKTPWVVFFYLTFFATLEILTSHYFLPPGAFGPWLAIVCFGLTLPVSIAAFLVWRHERRHGEDGGEGGSQGVVFGGAIESPTSKSAGSIGYVTKHQTKERSD